jgi:CRISPR-associated protein Cas5t
MDNKNVLRVKIYQPTAHFRVPFSYQRRFAYPLPPYSTTKGLLCNLFGISSDDEFENLISSLSIGIYGCYESILTEYIWLRDVSKDAHTKKYGSVENRTIDGTFGHIGGQIPAKIDVLENARFTLYFYHNNLDMIEKAFKNPIKRLSTIHLGRSEDWLVFEEIKKVNLTKKVFRNINKNCWIPEKICNEFYIEGYSDFFKNISGNIFNLTSIYEITENQRSFTHYIKTKLFEGGSIPKIDCLCDDYEKIPLFMSDLK